MGILQWQPDIHQRTWQQMRRPHACTDSSTDAGYLTPLGWRALFLHWAVWVSRRIDHHFLLNMEGLCCGWLERSCPYTVAQLGHILSYPSKQMPAKSNSGVLPAWKAVLSLPQFLHCYEIIDKEKPTRAGWSQKRLMLQAAADAWPFNHT